MVKPVLGAHSYKMALNWDMKIRNNNNNININIFCLTFNQRSPQLQSTDLFGKVLDHICLS